MLQEMPEQPVEMWLRLGTVTDPPGYFEEWHMELWQDMEDGGLA